MNFKTSIMWFRRDLRFFDNVALSKASFFSEKIIPVFIFDEIILKKLKNKRDRRVQFIFDSIKEMKQELNNNGKGMIVIYGDPVVEIPKMALKYNAQCIFTNEDYEEYAIQRDKLVENNLKQHQIEFKSFKDQVIFDKNDILKSNKQPYVVFTPYKNEWLKNVNESYFKLNSFDMNKMMPIESIKEDIFNFEMQKIGFQNTDLLVKPGRKAALNCLNQFSSKINLYAQERDFFAKNGTSFLSMHLRFGTISIREAFQFANHYHSEGAKIWKYELIWREFYKMILYHFPYVEKGAFKKECDNIKWENKEEYFEKWKKGLTGFPIIDAAMRYFNETGWMHNRLRMIVASFLTKDLLIDYKKGEEYFAENLLDFDLSSNNGGWQWSASTGCDAQPYFRVFNPEAQSIKFDPLGAFIKQHCPELIACDSKQIHSPYQYQNNLFVNLNNYPKPIVEHDKQRLKAIALFKK